ncbi:MAG TPA: hypothetical protein VFG51_01685 [Candidatus Saccharimonadia bacterium]|nr:hypothetical protein [Candidatus Saccharimonadia bacterium]
MAGIDARAYSDPEFEASMQFLNDEERRRGLAHKRALSKHQTWRTPNRLPTPTREEAKEIEHVLTEQGLT